MLFGFEVGLLPEYLLQEQVHSKPITSVMQIVVWSNGWHLTRILRTGTVSNPVVDFGFIVTIVLSLAYHIYFILFYFMNLYCRRVDLITWSVNYSQVWVWCETMCKHVTRAAYSVNCCLFRGFDLPMKWLGIRVTFNSAVLTEMGSRWSRFHQLTSLPIAVVSNSHFATITT